MLCETEQASQAGKSRRGRVPKLSLENLFNGTFQAKESCETGLGLKFFLTNTVIRSKEEEGKVNFLRSQRFKTNRGPTPTFRC
jgi:hypothetical protein